MKYYRIRHSIDTEIIGRKYPQVERVLIPTQWDDPAFIQSYVNKEAPPDVLLPSPILYKGAKLTDLLSASVVGLSLNLLISDKLKRILESCNFYGMQFFSVKVIHQEKEKAYWILHPFTFAFDLLNIEQSVMGYYSDFSLKTPARVFIPQNSFEIKKEVELFDNRINDNEYDNKIFGITKIVFEESKSSDLFSLRCITGGTGFFISDKLKNDIQLVHCTGVVFTEPNERYP